MGLWDTKENYLTDVSSKFWCPARTTMGTPLKIPSMGESLLISLTRKTIVPLTLITTICIFFHSLDAALPETGNMYAPATKVSATGRGGLCCCQLPVSNDRPSLLPLSRDNWQNLQEVPFPFVLREIMGFCCIFCLQSLRQGPHPFFRPFRTQPQNYSLAMKTGTEEETLSFLFSSA